MIECVTVEQFAYFIALMGDIAQQIDATTYVIKAVAGDVTWALSHGDYCRISS